MFALGTWRCTGCWFILDLIVCVGDLEMDRMWIDTYLSVFMSDLEMDSM